MNLPATGVMMLFLANGSRVRVAKVVLEVAGMLDRLVRAMLV